MGRKAIDLTNQRFGHVLVLRRSERKDNHKRALWVCQCDCGTIFEEASTLIRNNKSGEDYSCGCQYSQFLSKKSSHPRIDLTNQTFGDVTVLEWLPNYKEENNLKKGFSSYWKCQCKCGTIFVAGSEPLRNGTIINCGCIKKTSKTNEFVGKQFGKLTVLEQDCNKSVIEKQLGYKPTGLYWICQCECGEKISVSTNYLTQTQNPHCPKCFIIHGYDLTGQQFGHLTVLEKDFNYLKEHNIKTQAAYWKCQCTCGNIISVRASSLLTGGTRSCGCQKNSTNKQKYINEISGKRFGKLVAIEPVENYANEHNIKNTGNNIFWRCQCDCGRERIVVSSSLRSGEIYACSACSYSTKGETRIIQLLDKNNVKYLYNTAFFKDLNSKKGALLRYDFIIFDGDKPSYLIEYDGEQHFHSIEYWGGEEKLLSQQENDKIKNQYAYDNNLPLIRIPYTAYNNLTYKDLVPETSAFILRLEK